MGSDTWLWPRLDLHVVHGLHEARRGHEEGGVAHAARGGDELAAAARAAAPARWRRPGF